MLKPQNMELDPLRLLPDDKSLIRLKCEVKDEFHHPSIKHEVNSTTSYNPTAIGGGNKQASANCSLHVDFTVSEAETSQCLATHLNHDGSNYDHQFTNSITNWEQSMDESVPGSYPSHMPIKQMDLDMDNKCDIIPSPQTVFVCGELPDVEPGSLKDSSIKVCSIPCEKFSMYARTGPPTQISNTTFVGVNSHSNSKHSQHIATHMALDDSHNVDNDKWEQSTDIVGLCIDQNVLDSYYNSSNEDIKGPKPHIEITLENVSPIPKRVIVYNRLPLVEPKLLDGFNKEEPSVLYNKLVPCTKPAQILSLITSDIDSKINSELPKHIATHMDHTDGDCSDMDRGEDCTGAVDVCMDQSALAISYSSKVDNKDIELNFDQNLKYVIPSPEKVVSSNTFLVMETRLSEGTTEAIDNKSCGQPVMCASPTQISSTFAFEWKSQIDSEYSENTTTDINQESSDANDNDTCLEQNENSVDDLSDVHMQLDLENNQENAISSSPVRSRPTIDGGFPLAETRTIEVTKTAVGLSDVSYDKLLMCTRPAQTSNTIVITQTDNVERTEVHSANRIEEILAQGEVSNKLIRPMPVLLELLRKPCLSSQDTRRSVSIDDSIMDIKSRLRHTGTKNYNYNNQEGDSSEGDSEENSDKIYEADSEVDSDNESVKEVYSKSPTTTQSQFTGKFYCDAVGCEKTCTTKDKVQGHYANVDAGRDQAICYICDKLFCKSVLSNLTDQCNYHLNCVFTFCTKTLLAKHLLTAHRESHDNSGAKGTKRRPKYQSHLFMCHVCGQMFSRLDKLLDHCNYHLPTNPYPCTLCKKTFHAKPNLKNHIDFVHKKKRNANCTSSKVCYVCGKVCKSVNAINSHLRLHQEKKVKCNFCDKMFLNQTKFKAHMVTHTGERSFECGVCSKTFLKKCTLKRHILLTHLKTMKYKCPKCGNRFRCNLNLKEHMLKHDGTRKYSCKTCGKTFAQASHLGAHMFSHGEKKFACHICGAKFNRNDNMKAHVKRHKP